MSVHCANRLVALAMALLPFGTLHLAAGAAAEDRIQIVATDQPTNFFGGEQATLSFKVHSEEGFTGMVTWRLAAANRTLFYAGARKLTVAESARKISQVYARQPEAPASPQHRESA